MAQLTDFQHFLWRDGVLVLGTVCIWLTSDVAQLPSVAAIVLGAATAYCALQLHEWAHVGAGIRVRAPLHAARQWWHPFLYGLDQARCTREQFLAMSWPAFVATAFYLTAFLLWLPRDLLAGKVAFGIATIAASLTVLIEWPIAYRVWRGGSIPAIPLVSRDSS